MSSTAPFTLHGLTYHDCVYSSGLCSFWRKVFLNNTVSIILSFNARPNFIKYVVKTLSFGIAGNLTNFIITKYVEVFVFSYFSSKMWDLRIFGEWALFKWNIQCIPLCSLIGVQHWTFTLFHPSTLDQKVFLDLTKTIHDATVDMFPNTPPTRTRTRPSSQEQEPKQATIHGPLSLDLADIAHFAAVKPPLVSR